MSCCGQRRRAHRAWLTSRPIRLRFLGEGTIVVKGSVTGRPYIFSEEAREGNVDLKDARGFLQGSNFALVK